jgi:hypothetical protein
MGVKVKEYHFFTIQKGNRSLMIPSAFAKRKRLRRVQSKQLQPAYLSSYKID